MRSETAGKGIAKHATDLVSSLVNRAKIARKDAAERQERLSAVKRGPSVQERQQELVDFYERYEILVETLCDAAQYGPTPKLERSYTSERAWVQEHYGKLRPFVISYLRSSQEDPGDAFEALVASDDLGRFLQDDDGQMIERITRTREALTLYGEHLRQLAARTA